MAWGVHVGAQRLVQSRIPETKWLLQHRPGVAGFVDPFAAVAAILGPGIHRLDPHRGVGSSFRGRKRPLITLLLAGPVANLARRFRSLLVGFDAWVGTPIATSVSCSSAYGNLYLGGFVDFAVLPRAVPAGALRCIAQEALLLDRAWSSCSPA